MTSERRSLEPRTSLTAFAGVSSRGCPARAGRGDGVASRLASSAEIADCCWAAEDAPRLPNAGPPVATTGRATLSRAIGGAAADNGPSQSHPPQLSVERRPTYLNTVRRSEIVAQRRWSSGSRSGSRPRAVRRPPAVVGASRRLPEVPLAPRWSAACQSSGPAVRQSPRSVVRRCWSRIRLRGPEIGVLAAAREQGVVAPLFDDAAVVHHDDLVGVLNR